MLSSLLYLNYEKFAVSYAYRSNQTIIDQIAEHMMQIDEHTKINISTIFSSAFATRIMYDQNDMLNEYINDIKAIESIRTSNPYIHSIYIYNALSDEYHIIADKTIRRQETFYDDEIVDLIDMGSLKNPIPRIIPFSEREQEREINVYTYVLKGTKLIESNRSSSIIINVDSDELFFAGISTDYNDETAGEIYVVNQDNQIAGSNISHKYLSDVSNEAFIEEIKRSSDEDGYLISGAGATKKILIYSKLDSLKWILIKEIPYTYIKDMLDKVRIMTFIVISMGLIFSIGFAVYLSDKLYRPVRRLQDIIEKGNDNNVSEEFYLEEFDTFKNNYNEIYEEHYKLSGMNRNAYFHVKNSLIRNLLNGRIDKSIFDDNLLKYYDIRLNNELPALVVMFKIDHYESEYKKKFSESNQILYKFALNNIASEIIGEVFEGSNSADLGLDHTVTIVSLNESEAVDGTYIPGMQKCIHRIQTYLSDYADISVSGFVSQIVPDLYELQDGYYETLDLSKERFIMGHQCILFMDKNTPIKSNIGTIDSMRADIQKLVKSVKNGQTSAAIKIFTDMCDDMKKSSYEDAFHVINNIYYAVIDEGISIEKLHNISFELDKVKYHEFIQKAETLDEIKEVFTNLFGILSFDTDSSGKKEEDEFVQVINRFIHENYMIRNFSSNDVAEYLALSLKYVNRKYKHTMGVSISEQLKKIRLERASKLLIETDLPVESILSEIGWGTKEYFYISFKKYYGCTPGDYRSIEEMRNGLTL